MIGYNGKISPRNIHTINMPITPKSQKIFGESNTFDFIHNVMRGYRIDRDKYKVESTKKQNLTVHKVIHMIYICYNITFHLYAVNIYEEKKIIGKSLCKIQNLNINCANFMDC